MMYMMHLPLSDIQTLLVISQKIQYLNIIRKLYNIFYTFSALFVFLLLLFFVELLDDSVYFFSCCSLMEIQFLSLHFTL